MPMILWADCHPRSGAQALSCWREGTILHHGAPLTPIKIHVGLSDRPRSRDRISLPAEGIAPAKQHPQFAGDRIGSTENDVGPIRAIAINARRLNRAPELTGPRTRSL